MAGRDDSAGSDADTVVPFAVVTRATYCPATALSFTPLMYLLYGCDAPMRPANTSDVDGTVLNSDSSMPSYVCKPRGSRNLTLTKGEHAVVDDVRVGLRSSTELTVSGTKTSGSPSARPIAADTGHVVESQSYSTSTSQQRQQYSPRHNNDSKRVTLSATISIANAGTLITATTHVAHRCRRQTRRHRRHRTRERTAGALRTRATSRCCSTPCSPRRTQRLSS